MTNQRQFFLKANSYSCHSFSLWKPALHLACKLPFPDVRSTLQLLSGEQGAQITPNWIWPNILLTTIQLAHASLPSIWLVSCHSQMWGTHITTTVWGTGSLDFTKLNLSLNLPLGVEQMTPNCLVILDPGNLYYWACALEVMIYHMKIWLKLWDRIEVTVILSYNVFKLLLVKNSCTSQVIDVFIHLLSIDSLSLSL